ncbi:MAG: hypothetical protein K6C06_00780 [Lachnospiraceae bacterium]|nr:hypothetical protein [Lachnospiraceae bacterium]
MKRLTSLALILALLLSLAACSAAPSAAPAKTPAPAEQEAEAPPAVMPPAYEPFLDVADALVRGDYEGALALIGAMKPEPEPLPVEEVTVTEDNFFDYFEYVAVPDIYRFSTHRDSSGKLTEVRVLSGFYLKPEYVPAEEKLEDSHVAIHLRWTVLYFLDDSNITVDLENRSFTVTGPADEYTPKEETLTADLHHYASDEPALYGIAFPSPSILTDWSSQFTSINDPESFELVSAEGTLYLYGPPAAGEEPAAAGQEAETPAGDLPAAYAPFKAVLDALVRADYDAAQALVEEIMPQPEPLPVTEVTITMDNFFDYFEYLDDPGNYLEQGTERDADGNITRVVILSGFYLKPEYTLAEDKDSWVDIGLKWRLLMFEKNRHITVDLENRSYTVTGKPSSYQDYDDMRSAWHLEYPGEPARYGILFSVATILSDGKIQATFIKDQESFEFVSAAGTLYLAG